MSNRLATFTSATSSSFLPSDWSLYVTSYAHRNQFERTLDWNGKAREVPRTDHSNWTQDFVSNTPQGRCPNPNQWCLTLVRMCASADPMISEDYKSQSWLSTIIMCCTSSLIQAKRAKTMNSPKAYIMYTVHLSSRDPWEMTVTKELIVFPGNLNGWGVTKVDFHFHYFQWVRERLTVTPYSSGHCASQFIFNEKEIPGEKGGT